MITKNNKTVKRIVYNNKDILRVLLKDNNIVFTNASIVINGPSDVNVGDTNKYYLTINGKQYTNDEIKFFNSETTSKINMEYNTFEASKTINAENVVFTLS